MRDPDRVRAARRAWYDRNREHAKAKVVERKRRLIQKLQAFKVEQGCAECEERHPAVLECHHTEELRSSDPNLRVYNLIWRNGWGWARLRDYLDAHCEILCANCHRKRHWTSASALERIPRSAAAADETD